MTPASSPFSRLVGQAWADLQPFDGRFGMTWRLALLCALVTATAMLFKIPEAAISCYLIIFLMKTDAVQNCLMGFGLILLASLVVVLMIPVINSSIDSPAMRLAIIFFVSYVFLFLSSTTPLGEQAAIVGLIVAFIMTLITDVPVGQIGDQGLLAAWKMACMPMALMILFNLVLGVPAQTLVRNKIVQRLRGSAQSLEEPDVKSELPELLAEGNDLALRQMMSVKLLHLVPKIKSTWLNGAVETSYRIMLATLVPSDRMGSERRTELARAMRQAADEIAAGKIPTLYALEVQVTEDSAARKLITALAALSEVDGGASPKPAAQRLLAADAFTNPDHQRYALKTSLAAILCYLIYTGINWDGIHTALITCYVATLGTTGETVRKLTLRIVGCLIGAAMGVTALVFVMPNITTIGGLMVLVFCGVLVAAWVSSGSKRVSYSGVQIALAFLLTILNGFGPSFEFSQAGGRIAGILLGIFVIYVIFTQFWPKSVVNEVRERLNRVSGDLSALNGSPAGAEDADLPLSIRAFVELDRAEEMLDMAYFEPRRQRASNDQLEQYRQTLEDLRDKVRGLQYSA